MAKGKAKATADVDSVSATFTAPSGAVYTVTACTTEAAVAAVEELRNLTAPNQGGQPSQ